MRRGGLEILRVFLRFRSVGTTAHLISPQAARGDPTLGAILTSYAYASPHGEERMKLRGRMRVSALLLLGTVLGHWVAACGAREALDDDDDSAMDKSVVVQRLAQGAVDRLDILLAIDNSRSMADKQQILRAAVPDLISSLVNPPCVDADGVIVEQPISPLDDCAQGERHFEPVLDIHIGIISSSLGGHGADGCEPALDPTKDPTQNDHGWLIHRDIHGATISTYQDLGFLVWDGDPTEPTHSPAGESDADQLTTVFADMVAGVGELGCGFEANLESWYRFLIDPEPYQSIELDDPDKGPGAVAMISTDALGAIVVDGTLLQQRRDFLRPDSLLVIVMVADENDCSIRDGGAYWLVGQLLSAPGSLNQWQLAAPTAECNNKSEGPNDECCLSCWQAGTTAELCKTDDPGECNPLLLPLDEDPINLRCWDQKRRFGVDFLYPIDRYVRGLTEPQVPNALGEVMANPLFSDLDPSDENSTIRDPGLVFVAGIVGVPWQDIARRNAAGNPDLESGLDADGDPVGGFMTVAEMRQPVSGHSYDTWDLVLGAPQQYYSNPASALPKDPLMVESIGPRSSQPHELYGNAIAATHPITGQEVIPPGQNGTGSWNAINGHEWLNLDKNDLQYACIFPLQTTRDCSLDPPPTACDCIKPEDQSPLCQAQPTAGFGTTQYYGKAHPSLRQLQLLKDVGDRAIVASICPAQQDDFTAKDYGYRPAMGAVIERLSVTLGAQCLGQALNVGAEGSVSCVVIEATHDNVCSCSLPGRTALTAQHAAATAVAQDPFNPGWNCFCVIDQLSGGGLSSCQSTVSDLLGTHGWCYVDPAAGVGSASLVAECPTDRKRRIRFVGEGAPVAGSTVFLSCTE